MTFSRRDFLAASAGAAAACVAAPSLAADAKDTSITGRVGLVGGLAAAFDDKRSKEEAALDMPQRVRELLDLTVLDMTTTSLPSFAPAFLEKFRAAAESAGCVITNLKMNQHNLDMNSPDKEVRTKALNGYKKSIDAAALLGCRWARPLPRPERPDLKIHVDSYKELAEYAGKKNLQMLVENYAWMSGDSQSVKSLVAAIGDNVAASPDIGNWSDNKVRYAGLEATFPLAVTCDFKAKVFNPEGEHTLYDLKRCFDIGWKAGFRGPWCIEHGHRDLARRIHGVKIVRDLLRKWIAANG